jgi:hypothetical protein
MRSSSFLFFNSITQLKVFRTSTSSSTKIQTWAGAHFRPSPAKTPAEQLEQQLVQETYHELDVITDQRPEAGVEFIPPVE